MASDNVLLLARTKTATALGKELSDAEWAAIVATEGLVEDEDVQRYIGGLAIQEADAQAQAQTEEEITEPPEGGAGPEDEGPPAPENQGDTEAETEGDTGNDDPSPTESIEEELERLRAEAREREGELAEARASIALASARQEIANTDLGNVRYAPSAVEVLAAVRVQPTAENLAALQAHLDANHGQLQTVPLGEVITLAATAPDGSIDGEAWLSAKPIAEDTKQAVRALAASENLSMPQAYNEYLDRRRAGER